MKLVIVGGVAGGASAATRARRLSEGAGIVMIERGPDVSFANCGLPYYLGGEIVDRGKLLVTTPELLASRFRIDVRTRSEVLAIDRAGKRVKVRDHRDGRIYEETYDKLILSTGAAPIRPDLPGVDLPGIQTLRTLQDIDRIKGLVDAGARRIAVIGAGFIGLELVENLIRRGVSTTLIELQDQVLPPFDREMTTPLLTVLQSHGVDVRLGDSAEAFERNGEGLLVHLKSGAKLPADLVLMGIGVRPESGLAKEAGLAVGPRGGVRTDEHMRTDDPDIYAVGDCAEITGFVSGAPTQIPLAGPANRQGRIAADHTLGLASKYRGTQGTAILRVFETVAAMTGETEKSLVRVGRPFVKIYVHPSHHAGYYPGARSMTIKLLFDPDNGRILGGQIVGEDGVANRINVLATAIQAGMSVYDLEEAELAYSPQFGSAKDAINMAGFVAAGIARGDYPQEYAENLKTDDPRFFLDVRTPSEVALGKIPGSIAIPIDELRTRIDELPRDRPIVVYCQAGQRGYVATRLLRHEGFDALNLAGGYRTYRMVRPVQ